MSHLHVLRRRCGIFATSLALIVSGLTWVAPAAIAGSPVARYVATPANGGDDGSNGSNDCSDPAHPCATIAQAISEAVDGDTIDISSGSYLESIDIEKSVTISGAGAGTTVIHWVGGPAAVTIGASAADISVALGGVTVFGDRQSAVGVRAGGTSTTTISHSVVANGLDGIDVSDAATVSVSDTAITGNIEYGIGMTGGSVTTGPGTTITGNEEAGIFVGIRFHDAIDARLTVDRTTMSGNAQGIFFNGTTAVISSSTIAGGGDAATGVQILHGSATITNTAISGIVHSSEVGLPSGVTAGDATVSISDSTISGNVYGVISLGGTVTMTSTTVAGNQEPGLSAMTPWNADAPGGTVMLVDSTVADNSTAGNDGSPDSEIDVQARTSVSLAGTIVGGGGHAACSGHGAVIDAGYNLISDATCGAAVDHTLVDADPELGPLADNGGPTHTMMPGAGSPAVDAIPAGRATCVSTEPTDQRGVTRPVGPGCDIGAVEAPAAVPPPAAPAPVTPAPVTSAPACPPLMIDTTTLPDGAVGRSYSVQLLASGGCDNLYTWAVPGNAPDGGFPAVGSQITVPAASWQSSSGTHARIAADPRLASTELRAFQRPESGSPAANAAPPGLTVSSGGVLHGAPTKAGRFTFTVSVDDQVLATLVLVVWAPADATSSAVSSSTGAAGPSQSIQVAGRSKTAPQAPTSGIREPLASTGAPVGAQLRIAWWLLAIGVGLVLVGGRRRRSSHR